MGAGFGVLKGRLDAVLGDVVYGVAVAAGDGRTG